METTHNGGNEHGVSLYRLPNEPMDPYGPCDAASPEPRCGEHALTAQVVLESLHRWGPSLALLAAGFLGAAPGIAPTSVGGGAH